MAKLLRPQSIALQATAAVAAVLMPVAAHAQSAPISAARWSKAQAILGGAPSALQAILAQQNGEAPARAELQPASYTVPTVTRAILREPAVASEGVASGRPDVFGSVALKVGTTRLDARWHRVERAPLTGEAARYAHSLADLDPVERLEAVNRYVNRRVEFMDDSRQYGRADVWSAAADTLRRGRGDCEDYAIAKLQMLRRAGFADRNLYLVIVKDLISRADHAVLVVRAAGRMVVLDNGTERLLDTEEIHDYRPVLTFASTGTWTHGYRVNRAPVAIASVDEEIKDVAPSAADQRSWSASLLAFNTGFNK
jgi:predicted transglutaminase-like cysteine proteinase